MYIHIHTYVYDLCTGLDGSMDMAPAAPSRAAALGMWGGGPDNGDNNTNNINNNSNSNNDNNNSNSNSSSSNNNTNTIMGRAGGVGGPIIRCVLVISY